MLPRQCCSRLLNSLYGYVRQASVAQLPRHHLGVSLTQLRSFTEPAVETAVEGGLIYTKSVVKPRRTGVIAIKAGMTQEWDQWGVHVPLTVLWIDECQVVQVKRAEKEGINALQLGVGIKRHKQLNRKQRGHFIAAGVPFKRKMAEFRVSEDCLLPRGTEITASHFVAGQYVDIAGTTIGKGFQGVMKRWGFAGGSASHGNSKAHRSAGSTGACQDPGKVWKGKKMAGRMGGKRRTVQNCFVYKVDPERNLLYVKGQVPGHKGNYVFIKDSVKKRLAEQPPLPVPTRESPPTEVQVAGPSATDPYNYKE